MPMRHAASLLALAVAACATADTTDMPLPEGVNLAAPSIPGCRREAADAPQVRAISQRMPPPTSGDAYDRWRDDRRWAMENVFVDCLIRTGALVPVPGQTYVRPRFGYDDRPAPRLPD
jgi:hypothetical protein